MSSRSLCWVEVMHLLFVLNKVRCRSLPAREQSHTLPKFLYTWLVKTFLLKMPFFLLLNFLILWNAKVFVFELLEARWLAFYWLDHCLRIAKAFLSGMCFLLLLFWRFAPFFSAYFASKLFFIGLFLLEYRNKHIIACCSQILIIWQINC